MIHHHKLDIEKAGLGVGRESFTGPFTALILSSSIYKDCPVISLMEYRKDGHYYCYEDEYVVFYGAAAPTSSSSVFMRLKSKKIYENEKACLFLPSALRVFHQVNDISFKLEFKRDEACFLGVLCTPELFKEKTSEIINAKNGLFFAPLNYLVLNQIDLKEIKLIFEELSSRSAEDLEIGLNLRRSL